VHATVTTSPSDDWATQQIREATPWGSGPKYLIFDNDDKFGSVAVYNEKGLKPDIPPKLKHA